MKSANDIVGCIFAILMAVGFISGLAYSIITDYLEDRYNEKYTKVHLVGSDSYIDELNTQFIGEDTIYINLKNVYKNDTGKDLIFYQVKYVKNAHIVPQLPETPRGFIVKPNTYFVWNGGYERIFEQPSESTTIYSKHKINTSEVYNYFLDYASNVKSNVRIIETKFDIKPL